MPAGAFSPRTRLLAALFVLWSRQVIPGTFLVTCTLSLLAGQNLSTIFFCIWEISMYCRGFGLNLQNWWKICIIIGKYIGEYMFHEIHEFHPCHSETFLHNFFHVVSPMIIHIFHQLCKLSPNPRQNILISQMLKKIIDKFCLASRERVKVTRDVPGMRNYSLRRAREKKRTA